MKKLILGMLALIVSFSIGAEAKKHKSQDKAASHGKKNKAGKKSKKEKKKKAKASKKEKAPKSEVNTAPPQNEPPPPEPMDKIPDIPEGAGSEVPAESP